MIDAKGRHRLGFAVKVVGERGLPSHDTRRWQSSPSLAVSLANFEAILNYLAANGIKMYRMASDFVPYGSHPTLTQFHGQIESAMQQLVSIGQRVVREGVRLSIHPGQYVVVNSTDEKVRATAQREIELHASLLDAMGLGAEAVIVLHVGARGDNKLAAIDRFLRSFDQLNDSARARLVIENDEFSFDLSDVLDISSKTGTRVVWDIHHHHCNNPNEIPDLQALKLSHSTWPAGQRPKIHFSSPKTKITEKKYDKSKTIDNKYRFPRVSAHADLIDPIAFEQFIKQCDYQDFDIMLEAKAKDLALLHLVQYLKKRGFSFENGELFA